MKWLGPEKQSLEELRQWLAREFGERLRAVSVFGSRARGEGNEHSDLDVFVMVDGLTSAERRAIAHYSGELWTRHDVLVARALLLSRGFEPRSHNGAIHLFNTTLVRAGFSPQATIDF